MKAAHRVIALIGFSVACALADPAGAQPDRNSPPDGIDAKPYLAEGFVQSPVQVIVLQRMQAACPAQTKRAVMFDRRGPLAWFGCWRERDGKVEIAFEDGDFVAIAHDSFVWLQETGA
ncbi:MAG TPA: hypothetical protein VLW55_04150 [Burkholderiaceae bacterium]|nr:hypothetical protein [Burkholderiaceae bacterium]